MIRDDPDSGAVWSGQAGSRIRLEWGAVGAAEVAGPGGLAVVVDVFSFTTTLTIAAERGIEVYPYEWGRNDVAAFASARGAHHAVGRLEARRSDAPTAVSLSPARLLEVEGVERLALPSPNGSTISARLRHSGATVIGASLRNADAVGAYVARALGEDPTRVLALVPAGERWPDGSLRPAVEDLWGCGAVLARVRMSAPHLLDEASPEAMLGLAAYDAVSADLARALRESVSGGELAHSGFADDVAEAGRVNSAAVVPVLRGERFVASP